MGDFHAHKSGPLHKAAPVVAEPEQTADPLPTEPDDAHPVIQTTEVNGDGGVPGTSAE